MTEHELQNMIRLKLSSMGFVVFRANVGKFRLADGRWFDVGLPKGFSDLFAVRDGRVCFIEVKAEGGKVSEDQDNFLKQMKYRGCVTGVAYSVEDAISLAEQIK
jgi:hypothetical protein